MRLHPFLLAAVIAFPATAQTPAIAPSPSVVFSASAPRRASARPETTDTAFHQDARGVGTGLGVLFGATTIFVLSKVHHVPCDGASGGVGSACTTLWQPGFGNYVVGAVLGGVAGFVVGNAIHHDPARE